MTEAEKGIEKGIEAALGMARRTVTAIDEEIAKARAKRRDTVALVRRLETAKAVLAGEKRPRGSEARSGAAKAGPAAVSKVRVVAKEHGRMTQADMTRVTGLNSGQVSAAVASLEEAGVLKDTGKKVGRTREFEYAGT